MYIILALDRSGLWDRNESYDMAEHGFLWPLTPGKLLDNSSQVSLQIPSLNDSDVHSQEPTAWPSPHLPSTSFACHDLDHPY